MHPWDRQNPEKRIDSDRMLTFFGEVKTMQRVLMKMRILPGGAAEYLRRHALLMACGAGGADEAASEEERALCRETWQVHHDAGIRNYSIFLDGTALYAYFEAEDYQKTLAHITKSEAGQKWQAYMNGLLEQREGIPVMEIFDSPVFVME